MLEVVVDAEEVDLLFTVFNGGPFHHTTDTSTMQGKYVGPICLSTLLTYQGAPRKSQNL